MNKLICVECGEVHDEYPEEDNCHTCGGKLVEYKTVTYKKPEKSIIEELIPLMDEHLYAFTRLQAAIKKYTDEKD